MSSTAFINSLGLSGVCIFISGYFECEQKILLILSEIRVCPINSVANSSTLLHMDICILFPQTLQYQCTFHIIIKHGCSVSAEERAEVARLFRQLQGHVP